MIIRLPNTILSAVASAAVTAGALVALDATAATSPPQGNLKSIDQHVRVLEAELARQEKRSARIDETTAKTLSRVSTVYARLGRNQIQFGDPYNLLQRIYCSVEDISPCPTISQGR